MTPQAFESRADEGPLVDVRGVSKQFGRIRALDDVSISIRRGSVHAIVGENGAGKSTLAKIIAGDYRADSGSSFLDGRPLEVKTPGEALAQGIATVPQEPSIVSQLSVADNVLLGVEPRSGGVIRRHDLTQRYREIAASVGFDLPGRMIASRLRTSEQQQIEIMRALSRDARLIIMDEPSAALSGSDLDKLHRVIRQLADSGKAILLISHYLREVLELADQVTVLRDGRVVKEVRAADTDEQALVEAMLGRPLTAAFPDKPDPPAAPPVLLSVRHLSAPGVTDASFDVAAGEIVGLAGLVGAGRSELARAIIGAERRQGGEVLHAGSRIGRDPRHSLRAGVVMIPESRKDDGLVLERSVLENVSISGLRQLSRLGVVQRHAEEARSTEVLTRCGIRGAGLGAPVSALSGGNQQRVMFARMYLCDPDLVIADEPTRGVDVGAKRAIYDLLVGLAQEGRGVLLISSEVEEILGLAQRVLVMRAGRIVTELVGSEITERAILTAAFAEVDRKQAA